MSDSKKVHSCKGRSVVDRVLDPMYHPSPKRLEADRNMLKGQLKTIEAENPIYASSTFRPHLESIRRRYSEKMIRLREAYERINSKK